MSLDRTAFNALVDDDGSLAVGSDVNKAMLAAVFLDPVDAALAVPMPTCDAFAAAAVAAGQSIPTSTWTALLFDSEVRDAAAMHSTVTNSHRVTVPTTGRYLVIATVGWAGNATGGRYLGISLNSTANFFQLVASTGAALNLATAIPGTQQCIWIGNLSAGDFVEADVYQDSGSTLKVGGSGGTQYAAPRLEVIRLSEG